MSNDNHRPRDMNKSSGGYTPAMRVAIVSDTICPWCYIGKRRFERAHSGRPADLAVEWRPFQLNPDMPAEGVDRRRYMVAKFGSEERVAEIFGTIEQAGAAEGIRFAFDRVARTPNTVDSHRLIAFAGERGAQDQVVEALSPRPLSSLHGRESSATSPARRAPHGMVRGAGRGRGGSLPAPEAPTAGRRCECDRENEKPQPHPGPLRRPRRRGGEGELGGLRRSKSRTHTQCGKSSGTGPAQLPETARRRAGARLRSQASGGVAPGDCRESQSDSNMNRPPPGTSYTPAMRRSPSSPTRFDPWCYHRQAPLRARSFRPPGRSRGRMAAASSSTRTCRPKAWTGVASMVAKLPLRGAGHRDLRYDRPGGCRRGHPLRSVSTVSHARSNTVRLAPPHCENRRPCTGRSGPGGRRRSSAAISSRAAGHSATAPILVALPDVDDGGWSEDDGKQSLPAPAATATWIAVRSGKARARAARASAGVPCFVFAGPPPSAGLRRTMAPDVDVEGAAFELAAAAAEAPDALAVPRLLAARLRRCRPRSAGPVTRTPQSSTSLHGPGEQAAQEAGGQDG